MAAGKARRHEFQQEGLGSTRAYLLRERSETCGVFAGMPAALRAGLWLVALLERVEDLAGRLRREVLLDTHTHTGVNIPSRETREGRT